MAAWVDLGDAGLGVPFLVNKGLLLAGFGAVGRGGGVLGGECSGLVLVGEDDFFGGRGGGVRFAAPGRGREGAFIDPIGGLGGG